jgi:3-methylcrotonyl-CoA carboxylase alpha subunit
VHIFGPDGEIHATLPTPDFGGDSAFSSDVVVSPMDGSIKEVLVTPGDVVEEGQEVMTLYAMKVESKLRAPRSGVVESVTAIVGTQVTLNSIVLTLAPVEEEEVE